MKILITGATGFFGSHLTEMCVEKGYKVAAFDRYNPNYNLGWLENYKHKKEIDFIFGDIRDFESVYKSMKGCDSVFHLAALISIPYSYISPLAYYKTNVEGTYNVLESSKILGLDQILITSTSETYGTAKYAPIDEAHSINAQSPYSASKIAADHLSMSYWNSFRLPVKIVRPFNIYGPRQSGRAIIPSVIIQTLQNQKKIKLGNTNPTRDFTYVTDTCSAFIEIFKSKKLFGETTNIGTKSEISIKDVTTSIFKKLEINPKIIRDNIRVRSKLSEVDRLVCDNKKVIKFTKWRPKIKFSTGLDKTIEWFKLNKHLYRNDIYQI